MGTPLERDLRAYVNMIDGLMDESPGKFVLIHEGKRVDVFDDYDSALKFGYRKFRFAPIFVHKIEPISEAATRGRVAECRI